MMEHYGLVSEDEITKIDNSLDPIQCKCGYINPPSNTFCPACGSALRAETADFMKELQRIIENDPQAAQRFLQTMVATQPMPQP